MATFWRRFVSVWSVSSSFKFYNCSHLSRKVFSHQHLWWTKWRGYQSMYTYTPSPLTTHEYISIIRNPWFIKGVHIFHIKWAYKEKGNNFCCEIFNFPEKHRSILFSNNIVNLWVCIPTSFIILPYLFHLRNKILLIWLSFPQTLPKSHFSPPPSLQPSSPRGN